MDILQNIGIAIVVWFVSVYTIVIFWSVACYWLKRNDKNGVDS